MGLVEPLPHLGAIILLKLYHQIPIAEVDIPQTAVITPFRLYKFTRMPFGWKNAAQTFKRLMDKVLCGNSKVDYITMKRRGKIM